MRNLKSTMDIVCLKKDSGSRLPLGATVVGKVTLCNVSQQIMNVL